MPKTPPPYRKLADAPVHWNATVRQVTHAAHGHLLTNIGCWSPDSQWIYYDVRSDPAGSQFDGRRIERVRVTDGECQILYESRNDACCGVVTCAPQDERIVFIHGPEHPTTGNPYRAWNRHGVILDGPNSPPRILDARCLTEPFLAGALRGGSHVHTWDSTGQWIAFTYEDAVLAAQSDNSACQKNQRNVGVSVPTRPVLVRRDHPRNHDGSHFSVLITRTHDHPRPDSDEIDRAYEDAWIGTAGYLKADGSRQRRAVAFLGDVVTAEGTHVTELFVADLPEELHDPGEHGPLAGTWQTRPNPPRGVVQRRITFTTDRRYPGIQGPRHWPRSSPDGTKIGVLMRDEQGVIQIGLTSPQEGGVDLLTWNEESIASAFSFSPDGRWIAHVAGGSVCVTEVATGVTTRLTGQVHKTEKAIHDVRPEACVFSPDGQRIAYMATVGTQHVNFNQIFVVQVQLPG